MPDRPSDHAAKPALPFDRLMVRGVLAVALTALFGGAMIRATGRADLANLIWATGTVPVAVGLAVSIVRSFLAGRVGVDAIALVSMSGALALGEMLAAIVVAVMYAGGGVLEDFAITRAERDLRSLVDRAPRTAHRKSDRQMADIAVEQVRPGDTLQVNAGEVVPVDGTVMDDVAIIDESALTGEPIPVNHPKGARVLSGTVNAGGTFDMQAVATATDSAYAGVIRMVGAAQTAKAPFIRAADRFAILLLPLTLLVAGAAWVVSGDALRGLAVLVVATPCPLILAAPVAFVGGVSRAARRGILVKGGAALESLAQVRTVMFDKTGTLTMGGAQIVAIETAPGISENDVLSCAAALDQASHHVVAEAIVAAATQARLSLDPPGNVIEVQGEGISGTVGDRHVKIGSQRHVFGTGAMPDWAALALRRAVWRSSLAVFVAVDGIGIGALLMGDEVRADAPATIRNLRAAGVCRIVMLTGDRRDAAQTIGTVLGLDEVQAECTVAEKVAAIAEEQSRAPTIMVGDGINDAPALAAASVGIAMGARGASAASEAADVVLLVDQVDRVADAVVIAQRTRAIALQSMTVGLALSGIGMIAAAFGGLTPVQGALAQEAIDVAVILNALRTLLPGRSRAGGAGAGAMQVSPETMARSRARLAELARALGTARPETAAAMIAEACTVAASVLRQTNAPLTDDTAQNGRRDHLFRQLQTMRTIAERDAGDPRLWQDARRVIEQLVAAVPTPVT